MRQHSNLAKDTAEKVVKDIRPATASSKRNGIQHTRRYN